MDDLNSLSSITGVVTATMLVVHIIKRSFGDTPYLKKVPVWTYAVAVAIILTFIAKDFLHILQGDTKQLVWSAVLAAASSSGFFTWLNKPETVETAVKGELYAAQTHGDDVIAGGGGFLGVQQRQDCPPGVDGPSDSNNPKRP